MTAVGEKYRGTKEYSLVLCELIAAARYRGTVSYMKIARLLGIPQPGHNMARQVGQVLGEISEDEHMHKRPMLSAVAVGTSGEPGEGFYVLARRLERLQASSQDDSYKFWLKEREAVYEEWAEE
jgi:alkylated DNA nucleotide flippase Atl1